MKAATPQPAPRHPGDRRVRHAPARAEFPTGRSRLAGRVTDADGIARTVEIDPAESPLAWLRCRRDRSGEAMIDERQFAAGERLRQDHAIAGLSARVTMNWDGLGAPVERRGGGGTGGLAVSEAAAAARDRLRGAFAAVGPDLAGVLLAVCCEFRGLTDVERERDWPSRSAKVVLRLALDALARHYGLDRSANGPDRAPMRGWGTADYRPKA